MVRLGKVNHWRTWRNVGAWAELQGEISGQGLAVQHAIGGCNWREYLPYAALGHNQGALINGHGGCVVPALIQALEDAWEGRKVEVYKKQSGHEHEMKTPFCTACKVMTSLHAR